MRNQGDHSLKFNHRALGILLGVILPTIPVGAVFLLQINEPYVIDEAVFPYAAEGTLENGYPVFYNGETRPQNEGLWHPPLYTYILAGQIFLFGDSPAAIRSLGFVAVVLSALILVFAAGRLVGQASFGLAFLTSALFLTNPLVLSSSLVPDIDGTLGLLVLSIAAYAGIRFSEGKFDLRAFAWIVGLVAVAAWSKLIIAGVVIFVLFALLGLRRDRILGLLAASVSGLLLFLSSFSILGSVAGFKLSGPFNYLADTIGTGRGLSLERLSGSLGTLFAGSGASVTWVGPAILLATLGFSIHSYFWGPKSRQRFYLLVLPVLAISVIVGYSLVSGNPFGFPKYAVAGVPFMAVALGASWGIAQTQSLPTSAERLGLKAIAFGSILIIPAVSFVTHFFSAYHLWRDLWFLLISWLSAFIFLSLIAFTSTGFIRRVHQAELRTARKRTFMAAALSSIIVVQFLTAATNGMSPFSSRYYYGEQGLKQIIEAVKTTVPTEGFVIAPKDVGLQSGIRFYEDAFFYAQDLGSAEQTLHLFCADYVVTRLKWDYSALVFPDHHELLLDFYDPIPTEGATDFQLLVAKTAFLDKCKSGPSN